MNPLHTATLTVSYPHSYWLAMTTNQFAGALLLRNGAEHIIEMVINTIIIIIIFVVVAIILITPTL